MGKTSSAAEHVLLQLGHRIRESRLRAGLTQEEAASKAGIDWRRWQRLEAGDVNATVRTLVRTAEALDTDFWTMVGTGAE